MCGSTLYISLLQYRGAIHFKAFLPRPEATTTDKAKPASGLRALSLSKVLDGVQSSFAPVVAFAMWMLLRIGVYSRGWYVSSMWILLGLTGLRSFHAIVMKRFATLTRVAPLLRGTRGSLEEHSRRRNIVCSKFITLFLDMTAVFLHAVFVPMSVVIFGSAFNSQQMAIHATALGITQALALALTNVNLHIQQRKRDARTRREVAEMMSTPDRSSEVPRSTPSAFPAVNRYDDYVASNFRSDTGRDSRTDRPFRFSPVREHVG
jgi:hypothetical protein